MKTLGRLTIKFLSVLVVGILIAAMSRAEIAYTVRPDGSAGKLYVSITFLMPAGETELQIPRWAPGSYRLVDTFRSVSDFKVEGLPESAEGKKNDNTWAINARAPATVTVSYSVPSPLQNGAMHYSGPSTYMYIVSRKEEPCRLELEIPENWKVAIGLDEVLGQKNTYVAPNYDVLADNPVTLGDFVLDTYMSRGRVHFIAYRGAEKDNVDREHVKKMCRFISESQADFFGGFPFRKYVWHFNVSSARDGGGGLEHLSSTQIGLAVGAGDRSAHVCAHEYFHLWNVKRIRSRPLGPFDYTQLPKTGALWWLEGVTDYYASLLQFRYGWWDEDTFFKHIGDNVRGVRANPARMEVSPNDASMRVGEAADGRGNSNGYRVSYYNTGWLVGMCLDTEIRFRTGGKHSLDDVMRALYELCKDNQPGFDENEIRDLCVRFGGSELGAFYDKIVMQPGELPVEDQLAKMGLRIADRKEFYVDPGFEWIPNSASKLARISAVRDPATDLLKTDDLLLEVDGKTVGGTSTGQSTRLTAEALESLKANVPAKLKVKRAGQTVEVTVTPAQRSRQAWRVTREVGVDQAKINLRNGWYYAGKKPAQPPRQAQHPTPVTYHPSQSTSNTISTPRPLWPVKCSE